MIAVAVPEIALESCSIGDTSYAPFMTTRRFIQVVFKNNVALPVIITRVTCWFESEPGLAARRHSVDAPVEIAPGGRSESIIVPFTVDLGLYQSTNYAHVEIEYVVDNGAPRTLVFGSPSTAHMMVLPITAIPKNQLFISYKISTDTKLAHELHKYLHKIGFRGYIAEDDPRYGHDMYTGKFAPEINNSSALIVLWTGAAAAEPGTVQWELEYALSNKKRILVIKEDGVDPPPSLSSRTERFHAGSPVSRSDLVKFVTKFYRGYQRGFD